MFGISWAEFLVILFVAVLVIPTRHWPDVARFVARAIKYVRRLVWKITDASEQIRDQIDMQRPIDDLLRTTTDDVLNQISELRPAKKQKSKKRVTARRGGLT